MMSKNGSLWITEHKSGKLEGLVSINTSTLENPFCQSQQQVEGSICGRCYAKKLENLRPSLESWLKANSRILANKVLTGSEVPHFTPGSVVRFNSFGELINLNHFENLLKICRENPLVKFALWTKRDGILRLKPIEAKPANLIVVYSSPMVNQVKDQTLSLWFDRVFTVVDKNSNLKPNCSQKCYACMNCYQHVEKPFRLVVEMIR